tara:strand:+ start:39523 stop:39711 length:189 start_codon:yes stop_codon:yes gene_type:complete
MSAPETDPYKRPRRSKSLVLGIKGVLVIGALLMIVVVFVAVVRSTDGRTDIAPMFDATQQQD